MSRLFTMILIIIFIIGAIDSYLWFALSRSIKREYFNYFKWLIPLTSLLFVLSFFWNNYKITNGDFNASFWINFCIGLGFGIFIAKTISTVFFLIEDVFRATLFGGKMVYENANNISFPSRRNFVRNLSLAVSAIPILGTIYAITKGKYNLQTKRIDLSFKRLPKAFEGLKIMQFSDFHAGSFDNTKRVQKELECINEEKPDLILFTGDLVNNRAEEVYLFKKMFSNLKAKYGKFAVLGNHDYGDYIPFKSKDERQDNLDKITSFYEETGFTLLNNTSVQIKKEEDTISIIGVENWGTGHFPQYGDIEIASENVPLEEFNIVLSHDPDHWEFLLRTHPKQFDLTLSGHTHGFQAGIEISGWKWSPSQYRYKRWLGLYSEGNRYLFVSKGFGFLGYPGRIGMSPEIVCFTLYANEDE